LMRRFGARPSGNSFQRGVAWRQSRQATPHLESLNGKQQIAELDAVW